MMEYDFIIKTLLLIINSTAEWVTEILRSLRAGGVIRSKAEGDDHHLHTGQHTRICECYIDV